jgi:proline racemase
VKVSAVDYHTAGEPFRIVTGGVEELEGATILEKRRFAAERLDRVRKLLVNEPRGHADMYGCFVTEPNDAGADLGVVFFHNAGYSTACGHGTIALATWAIDEGRVAVEAPETRLVVDVPSGRLPVVASVRDGRVDRVRFRNVPAWVFAEGLDAGGVPADVSYGGAFYASVAAADLGLAVDGASLPRLIEAGREIKRAIEAEHEVVNPDEPEIRGIYGVIFWQPEGGVAGELVQRNVTVFADGEVDRSPCGSGTSARLALLDARGELDRGAVLRHRSILGTEFEASVVGKEDGGVITEVAGSAFRTGMHEFTLDPADELGTGFLLR